MGGSGYNHRMDYRRVLVFALLAGVLAAAARSARAGRTVGSEWWLGGGFYKADYHEKQLAVIRGGGGLLVLERITLGACLQADREHWFGSGYAGVIFPVIGPVEPYGRFHAGQRNDGGDTVLGWTGGFRYGDTSVKLYVEAFGIIEPGYGTGVCIGFTF